MFQVTAVILTVKGELGYQQPASNPYSYYPQLVWNSIQTYNLPNYPYTSVNTPDQNYININQQVYSQHNLHYNNPVQIQVPGHYATQSSNQLTHYNNAENENSQTNIHHKPFTYASQNLYKFDQVYNEPTDVKKHIYFHIPPPDLEGPKQISVAVPKKTYKIIFIKMPSQESRNNILLQRNLNSYNNKVEEKTLIYLLIKKPEINNEVLEAKTVHSNPEVFYVKYKDTRGSLNEIASQVNAVFAGPDFENITLKPGLVNGQPYK